ncbi:hypothetical protein C2L64_46080 [Paraburkholderia hospita]|uniref:Uncharacterized protein n=2 Tax=Paraburkholderia hospita TaxID=169430 RepID=A0AAN1JKT9_9BURK|nr:hypothetical protein C2L64_46080 [Paraburkholderia hospita]
MGGYAVKRHFDNKDKADERAHELRKRPYDLLEQGVVDHVTQETSDESALTAKTAVAGKPLEVSSKSTRRAKTQTGRNAGRAGRAPAIDVEARDVTPKLPRPRKKSVTV